MKVKKLIAELSEWGDNQEVVVLLQDKKGNRYVAEVLELSYIKAPKNEYELVIVPEFLAK